VITVVPATAALTGEGANVHTPAGGTVSHQAYRCQPSPKTSIGIIVEMLPELEFIGNFFSSLKSNINL
jgi:hypothetical protein